MNINYLFSDSVNIFIITTITVNDMRAIFIEIITYFFVRITTNERISHNMCVYYVERKVIASVNIINVVKLSRS